MMPRASHMSIEEFRLLLCHAEDTLNGTSTFNKVHPPMYALSKGQTEQAAALESLQDARDADAGHVGQAGT